MHTAASSPVATSENGVETNTWRAMIEHKQYGAHKDPHLEAFPCLVCVPGTSLLAGRVCVRAGSAGQKPELSKPNQVAGHNKHRFFYGNIGYKRV